MHYNEYGQPMTAADAEDTAAWFIRHMTMEQRREFMSERPLLYARLFPALPAAAITGRVRDAITAGRKLPGRNYDAEHCLDAWEED